MAAVQLMLPRNEKRAHHTRRRRCPRKKIDGEFSDRYFNEIMDYIEMTPERFHELCDKFKSPHLLGKDAEGKWKLRHNVWGGGLDD